MDFTLPPEIDAIRLRTRAFVDSEIIPLEAIQPPMTRTRTSPCRYSSASRKGQSRRPLGSADAAAVRRHGDWPGGPAAMYEEANRSIFGPVVLQLRRARRRQHVGAARLARRRRRTHWLQPIIDGEVRPPS